MIANESDFGLLRYDSRPGAWMAEASCFTFIRNRSARWAGEGARLTEAKDADWSAVVDLDDLFTEYGIALFDVGDWAVIYQYNGFPEQFVHVLVGRQDVDEAVIVFWNVNGVIEFSYWRRGATLTSFEFPDERYGAEPDALLPAMGRAGVSMQTYEASDGENGPLYYRSLLPLAAGISGVVI